jgi:hypothetical protein
LDRKRYAELSAIMRQDLELIGTPMNAIAPSLISLGAPNIKGTGRLGQIIARRRFIPPRERIPAPLEQSDLEAN